MGSAAYLVQDRKEEAIVSGVATAIGMGVGAAAAKVLRGLYKATVGVSVTRGAKRAFGFLTNAVGTATSSGFFNKKTLSKKKQIAAKVRSWRKGRHGPRFDL